MKFTVHINVPISGERNDFLLYVNAPDVTGAVVAATERLLTDDYGLIKSDVLDGEVLDVFKGHVQSLWDRPHQRPVGGA